MTGPLLNTRHELFCQARARGLDQTASYIAAGYKAPQAKGNASTLAKKDAIRARIAELIRAQEKKTIQNVALTEEWIIGRLKSISDATSDPASEKWNPAAASRALELLGKTLAMFTDRIDQTTRKAAAELHSTGELDEEMARLRAEIADLEARRERATNPPKPANADNPEALGSPQNAAKSG